jgi:MFS family permease
MLINLTISGAMVAINLQLVRTHTAPLLIGLIDAVAGAVMLLGSVLAPLLLKRFPAGWLSVAGLGLVAASFIGMAVVHSYAGYVVLVGVGVLLIPAVNAGIGGYVAAIVPDALQGRVSSVSSLGYLAVAPLAPVVASLLLAHAGIVPALWIFAAALAAGVIGITFVRDVRGIGTPDTWGADAIEWPRPEASAQPAR